MGAISYSSPKSFEEMEDMGEVVPAVKVEVVVTVPEGEVNPPTEEVVTAETDRNKAE